MVEHVAQVGRQTISGEIVTENGFQLSVVIPAYNEAERIAESLIAIFKFLDGWAVRMEVIVVDDGSADATPTLLERFAADHPTLRVMTNPRNLGKGASIKRGVMAAGGKHIFFMDADLSVPIDELKPSYETMVRHDYPILIGSRRVEGARIMRRQPWLRQSLGHGFTYLARVLLCWDILDFTCGFKGFRRDVARLLFSLQRRADWAFDAEVLYLAKLLGIAVCQHPIRWSHCKGSRVRFPHDLVNTLAGLIAIRLTVPRLVRNSTGLLASLPEDMRRA